MITEERISIALQEKIEVLVKRCLEAMPEEPLAIYLVGGYGRGEGSWYEDEKGLHPYNDFDLAVITENPLSIEETDKLRTRLASEVSIQWVDIDYYTLKRLSSLKPTIHNVDLLFGSKLIFGKEDVLKKCPAITGSQIGLYDVILLYRTRIWTFLGSWQGDFHDLYDEEARFFKNQMAKATLSICDLLLIPSHQYTTSYKKRAEIVCSLYETESLLVERIKWAINEKLRPSSTPLTKEEMTNIYFEVKSFFIWALSNAFGKKWSFFGTPNKIKIWYYTHTTQILRDVYGIIRRGSSRSAKVLEIFIAQIYVFMANDNGTINNQYLNKAQSILKKCGYIDRTNYEWSTLHNIVAEARNNI